MGKSEKKKSTDNLNIIESIMVEYLQFKGNKDKNWHDTLKVLQSINNKEIMDSDKVNQWLKDTGAFEDISTFLKFNKEPNSPAIYKKMEPSLLDIEDDGWIYQEVADHISNLFQDIEDSIFGVEKLLDAPQCAKNIHYLWLFSCEVGSGGLFSYVNNYFAWDLEWLLTMKALKAVGADKLVQRFESCIVLSLENERIASEHDKSNYNHLKVSKKYDDFKKIDDDIYELISEPFNKLVADYIKMNKLAFFD